ncbi:MAG: discoidin domain-containing protein, partial [Candidatus Omnitrophica bacterium]|nr:discoidin domain-containing protein [Candidatus Omnitrophota bacterium]
MYIKKFLSALGIVFLSAFSCITNTAFPDENGTQELLTPENMARWKAGIASSSRSAITFDENAREIRINGYGVFYDDNDRYEDIRLDCVVNFRKFEGKYAGFSIYVRDGDGKRYWVYLRPAQRSLSAVKIHSNSKTINEYYEQGSKLALRPDTVNLNQDYTFSVEVVGRKLSAFLDGKKIIEFVDPLPEAYMRGRIGFHGSDNCDVTIKSIKVTDLTVSELLPVQSYEYINPPEKGDTSGKILTDGKINGKEEQALWWLATKGDPVIVFDLGKEYFINGVNLKALAPPNANISAYRVLASTDNDKWKTLAGEVNNSSDSREQEQVLQASFSGIARYVKAMLFRSAGDDTIKLDEVEILGREVRPEDEAAASAPEAYYTGPEIPETAMSGDSDANWFYLEGGGLRFSVSRTTGSMGPVYNLSKQERCTMVSYDAYNVETKNRDGQEFSEKDNTVIETKTEKGILTLTCRNKNIPDVDIVQTYKTTPYGISKKTEFVNRGQAKDLFLTIRTGVVLDQKFREEGWYMGADRGLGARLKASQVTLPMTTTAHSPKNTKVVLFMNYGENFGIGQYRYAINGKHCEPVAYYTEKSNHSPLYTANGWEMGLVTLHLEPGKPRSAEVHWDLFPEDEFYFFKQYTSIPEVNKKFNIDRPDWLLRLKTCPSDLGYDFGGRANGDVVTRRIKRSIDLYDDGYIYFLVTAEDVWGDWYQGERCGLGWSGQKIDNEYFREKFDELRKEFPNLKTGVYTWAWSGWQYSDSYTNHPEWYITNNKQGFPRKAYQNGPMNYMRLISAPGSMEYFLAAADKIIKQFDSDFFYIDGGGGGVNLIDWDKLTLDYDTDWEEFHWGLNKATRKAGGKERVFFTNSRSEPYVDMGFYEGVNNKLSSSSWRDSGDGMLSIKMRSSLFPKMTLIPIYWRTNTIQFYSNYCTGLGLVPENIYLSREVINVADVTAAYETRMFSFTPAELTPDWRRDIDTELEVYTLTHKPAAIFSIINHSKLPISQTVSADAAKLGIDTEKPMFLWLLRTHDARKKTTGVSERTAKEVYQRTGWGIDLLAAPEFKGIVKADDGHISITDTFDLDILNMAIFGNCPAVVFSVNGRRQQIWQPNARGITVNGSID